MTKPWRAFVKWLEQGDLVPFLVLASAWHYVKVLSGRDPWPVAIAIGLLVDLGHYRAVLIAVRYRGESGRERFARWLVALVMTGVSLGYHLRFYWPDYWLAIPIPLLIGALAYFDRKDAHLRRERRATTEATMPEPVQAEVAQTDNGSYQVQVYRVLDDNPEADLKTIAAATGCSVTTASRWRARRKEE